MDDLATLVTLMIGGSLASALLVAPVLIYRNVTRRHADSWTHTEREYVPTGGAYRGTVVDLVRSPGMPDGLRGPCMWSLYMLVPALVSLPVLALGMLVDLDPPEGVGAAWVLGPSGLALAIAIFVVGLRMPRRQPSLPTEVRAVAIWEIVHNLVVLGAVVFSSGQGSGGAWKYFAIDAFGMVAVPYALVSLVHAAYLLHAVRVVKEAPATVEAEAQVV